MSDSSLPPILVADDDFDDAFILRHRLDKSGITNPVLAFSDGTDVVDCLTRLLSHGDILPRVLLLDLKMPRMDGFDTIQWIRERRAFDALTITVVTSDERPADIERALAAGAHRIFQKFPTSKELAEIVRAPERSADARPSEAKLPRELPDSL